MCGAGSEDHAADAGDFKSAYGGEETEMKVRTVGITDGYPEYLEVMYDPISADPFVAAPGDILAEVFGVRGESR